MITSCPNCHTRFRVTPEQLAARQGAVRCGRCTSVFNGFATLERDQAKESLPQSAAPSASTQNLSGHIERTLPEPKWTPATDSSPLAEASARTDSSNEARPATPGDALQGKIDDFPPMPTWTPGADPITHGTQETAVVPSTIQATASPVDKPLSEDTLAQFAASLATSELDAKPTEPAPSATQSEALLLQPDLPKPARPRRAGWIVLCLLLLTLLAGQAGFLMRMEIVTHWPETKPYLADLCAQLGCELPLPKRIEEITIESSEMQADPTRPNVVLVTAILRNHGVTQLAYPLLEVTLTDTLENPIARRSLTAAEYLSPAPNNDEGLSPNSEAISRTAIEVVDVKPAGYRLQLYYR